jgi:hypothetical protein
MNHEQADEEAWCRWSRWCAEKRTAAYFNNKVNTAELAELSA